jgi:TonB family protein
MKPVHGMRTLITLLLAAAASGPLVAQPVEQRRGPLPQGSTIDAHDGDTVLIDDDARVRLIRRRPAHVRVVFDSTERWLILLARYRPQNGISTDVIDGYTFRDVEGDWTLDPRWEGDTTLEIYSMADRPGPSGGIGWRMPQGTVQVLAGDQRLFRDPAAAVVLEYHGSSRGTESARSFDEAERSRIAEASGRRQPSLTVGVKAGIVDAPGRVPSAGVPPPGSARKIHDVRPVWPEEAQRARVQGIVIVEFTVGADGAVADARILRGIPLLDQAALDCVRQWRYEPTIRNGQAIPVRMTAAVTFP